MIQQIQDFLKGFGTKQIQTLEPVNLDILKNEIIIYFDSGEWFSDIQTQLNEATAYITNEQKSNSCIVLDIDDTMVTEYQYALANDFAWTEAIIDQSNTITTFPAIKPMLNFYNWCLGKHLPIYIISSKREKYRPYAMELLGNAGYLGYMQMILRPDDDTQTIAEFKNNERAKLVSQGLEILCNIGDQDSDLYVTEKNNNTIHPIKIPNPLYYISEKL
jgi:predicted secreted acid phosphatase